MLEQQIASGSLLLETLNGCGELRILDVQIFHQQIGVGQALRLLVYDDSLCFESAAQIDDFRALLLPRF